MAENTDTVNNLDICGYIRRLDRVIYEVFKCNSSAVANISDHDLARFTSYQNMLREYLKGVGGPDALDMPETSPRGVELPYAPETVLVENETINDILELLGRSHEELVHSQSARLTTGLLPFDLARLQAVDKRVEKILTEYVPSATPIDLPESSPMRESSGSGRSGV